MAQKTILNYTFNAAAKQITFTDYTTIRLESIFAITNATTGAYIYAPAAGPTYAGSVSGNVLTLAYDTTSMNNTDKLQIRYDDPLFEPTFTNDAIANDGTSSAKQISGNVADRFKESFNSVDTNVWDVVTGSGDLIIRDGNVGAASFVRICKSTDTPNTESTMVSKDSWFMPNELMSGIGLSQRMNGQEFGVHLVGTQADGTTVDMDTPYTPVAVSGTITIASNVGTVTSASAHGLLPGDVICLYNNAYSPLNVGHVQVATKISATQFTVAITAANGTYTAGGYITKVCPCDDAKYMVGIRWVGATSGNADTVSKNEGIPQVVNWNPGNTQDASVIPNENGINYASLNYCVPFRPKGEWVISQATEYTTYVAADQDTNGSPRSVSVRRQNLPYQGKKYKIKFIAKNLPNMSYPVGPITVAAKSGSTTATLTIPSHGLTVNDFIVVYGIRDQTNFANLTTATVVASVVNSNQITIAFGASATASSYGGFAYRVNGGAIGAISAISAQTYAKTTDGLRVSLVGSGTWAQTIGNVVKLKGLVDSTNTALPQYEGLYRVAYQATTTMELEPLEGQNLTPMSTTPANCGGTVVLSTDFRLHYTKLISRVKQIVEFERNLGDRTRAVPVEILNTPTVSIGSNASCNTAQWGGQNVVTSGLNGSPAVGGTQADGSTTMNNPVLIAGSTNYSQKRLSVDGQGVVATDESIVVPFSLTATNTTEGAGVRTIAVPFANSTFTFSYISAATATLAVEGSLDGTTYGTITMYNENATTGVNNVTSVTAAGVWTGSCGSFKFLRVHCTAFTSGTGTGTLKITNTNTINLKAPTYSFSLNALTPTASTNLCVIESSASKVTTLKRLIINPGTATANGWATLTLTRNTVAASAAGTAVTPSPRESSDAAFAGIVRSGAFTLTGVTSTATQIAIPIPTPISTTTTPAVPFVVDFTNGGTIKGVTIPMATTNGLMLVHSGLAGAANFGITAEFTEE